MTRMRWRRGTAAEWTAANPILLEGEVGWETDTDSFKVGDGSTAWSGLAYWTSGGGVTDISKSGDTPLTGSVTLSEGANVTLTQTGQDIEIAATAGIGSEWSVLTNGDPVTPELIFDGNGDVIMVETLR